jgi:hypothetical protein
MLNFDETGLFCVPGVAISDVHGACFPVQAGLTAEENPVCLCGRWLRQGVCPLAQLSGVPVPGLPSCGIM